MVWIASCDGIVWAVSANGELWYRAGISQNNPMGTNWFKMDTRPNAEAWKQAVMYEGSFWGIDGSEVVRCKEQAAQDQIFQGNSICIPKDYSKFDLPNETRTVVNVGIDIKDIPKIDDKDFSVTLNAFFVVQWTDERLLIDQEQVENKITRSRVFS